MRKRRQGDQQPGLTLRLGEGARAQQPSEAGRQAETSPLDAAAVARLLGRLPPIQPEAADQQDLALREGSAPPPLAGATMALPFPPPDSADQPSAAGLPARALEVLRYAPEGEVGLAPNLSITFSQPMVALSSHAQLATLERPLRLQPEPPGQWRWVGTQTLLFEPAGRFPMATEYRVEVPAGSRAAGGARLSRPLRWSFKTSPLTLEQFYPSSGPQRTDQLIFLCFDQRVDASALLPLISARAGRQHLQLRQASAAELSDDQTVSALVEQAQPGRWLVLAPLQPYPAGSEIKLTLARGAPSAEGPLTTTKQQGFSFSTYDPLKIVRHSCGWRDHCPPFTTWRVEFNNPLDEQSFDPALVQVSPALPGMRAEVSGSYLLIHGPTRARVKYTVTIGADLLDSFEQRLGKPQSVSFEVGPAEQMLSTTGGQMVVLDPSGPPRFPIFSVNHESLKLRIYRLGPEDWLEIGNIAHQSYDDDLPAYPGRLVVEQTIHVQGERDELAQTQVDLSPALEAGLGQCLVVVEPSAWPKERWQRRRIATHVQVTRIGLSAFVDAEELLVWTSALADGAPLAAVEVWLDGQQPLRSDAEGLARLALPEDREHALLVARQGQDVALLPHPHQAWSGSLWRRRPTPDEHAWYVFDDRKMYRPGEQVHLKGWIRRRGTGEGGDVGLDSQLRRLTYSIYDSRNNELGRGELEVGALGGFDLAFDLPQTPNLGYARVDLVVAGEAGGLNSNSYSHSFQIEEFRRPEFEVTVRSDAGPHFIGGAAVASVRAGYYAGGALPGAEVSWHVTAEPGSFTPPGCAGFSFGTWTPWWESWGDSAPSASYSYSARTDGDGEHHLKIEFVGKDLARPYSISAEAGVTDLNRQRWNASARMLAHPAELYVGLRAGRSFVKPGQPLQLELIVANLEGQRIAGTPIEVELLLIDWVRKGGARVEQTQQVALETLGSTEQPLSWSFTPTQGGSYRLVARIADQAGRSNQSQMSLWVAGGKRPEGQGVEQQKVVLIPDKEIYQPGEHAEILLQAPFTPAEGLLTLRRSGIVSSQRFSLVDSSHTLSIPIEEAHLPNLHVQVDLVGASPRLDAAGEPAEGLPRQPSFATGELNLKVPPLRRALSLELRPRDAALEPGGETSVELELRDADGRPVGGAEVALAVVDEAILALSGYRLDDPLAIFYPERPGGGDDHHSRDKLLLPSLDDLRAMLESAQPPPMGMRSKSMLLGGGAAPAGMPPPAPMMQAAMAPSEGVAFGGMAADEPEMKAFSFSELGGYAEDFDEKPDAGAPIAVRSDFNPLALFVASLTTGEDGRASALVKLPDNLTRYRVMALAVAGGRQFGQGEASITARLPLMLRPSAPRFLNFGDRCEIPVLLQNQTDQPIEVEVAARALGLELSEPGYRTSVPAQDRVEVRFPAATLYAGTARLQVGAAAGSWADAALIELPVWTPATSEALATYGTLDQGALVQPVQAPPEVFPQFGGLELTASSTALQALTDAVLYLSSYPFLCAEQLASRLLGIAALRDVLSAFEAEGLPEPAELLATVERDINRLQGMQNSNGGFGFWHSGEESWPYVSIHVAHALQRAEQKGFEVPAEMLRRSSAYLRQIERHIPSAYPEQTRHSLLAYAQYLRRRMGDEEFEPGLRLLRKVGVKKLSLEALGWLLSALSGHDQAAPELAELRRHLHNRVSETAGAAHFVDSYSDGAHLLLHSGRRADAIILEALIADDPSSDLIPKLVRGLLAQRVKGRWNNTQENVWVLLALDGYFAAYERETPDFVAQAWLGGRYAGGHAFKGRSTERAHIGIPMRTLAERPEQQELLLGKQGAGRLYYRLGLRYAPTNLQLEPADHGFTVERSYQAVDDPGDVRRDEDGTWRIKAGATVRVSLTLVAPARRYHVALVDPLPAGLEPLNPALAVSGSLPEQEQPARGGWWWWRPWYQHQNLRDERAEAFTTLLWEGVHAYAYTARATTPGSYVVPPPRAEEMYAPETFGRGASDHVVVE